MDELRRDIAKDAAILIGGRPIIRDTELDVKIISIALDDYAAGLREKVMRECASIAGRVCTCAPYWEPYGKLDPDCQGCHAKLEIEVEIDNLGRIKTVPGAPEISQQNLGSAEEDGPKSDAFEAEVSPPDAVRSCIEIARTALLIYAEDYGGSARRAVDEIDAFLETRNEG